jgi:hypothetical protein
VRRARSIVVYYLRGVGVVDGAAAAARGDGVCARLGFVGRAARRRCGAAFQRARGDGALVR